MDTNPFRTSSYSSSNGGACVEVAKARLILVRDSTNRDAEMLFITADDWTFFTAALR